MSVMPKLIHPDAPDEWGGSLALAEDRFGAPVAEMVHRVASASDPVDALQQVVEAAAAVTEGAGAVLLLAGSAPGRYRVAALAGDVPAVAGDGVALQDDQLVWSSGAEPNRLVRIEDEPVKKGKRRMQDAVSVPVSLYGAPLGELVALCRRQDAEQAASLRELARLVAPAAAVSRASSVGTELTELSAVVEVGQVLTGLLDMEDVLSYVVYLAESLVGGHAASVALLSEDRSEIFLKNSTGTLRGSEGRSIPVQGSLIGWVVEHGEAVIAPCVSDDPRGYSLGERQGPGVLVPITNNGQILGAFLVSRIEGAPGFSGEHAQMLQKMSAYAAIAITNAETHRRQREVAETLRQQATELELAYSQLSRSQDQLLISEKMAALGRVTAGIAHEINSPLGGVLNSLRAARGFVEEYKSSARDPEITPDDHLAIADDIGNALTTAESAVTKVAQFVKSIKGQTRVGEQQNGEFDPASEVDATVVLLQHQLKHRRVAVYTEMERGHRLSGDQGKFGVVVQNLISNALDAYEDRAGEIWVRLRAENEQLLLSVEDNGCGIPDEIRGKIFDYLFTTKDVGKGTGLGLAMVHNVVTTNFQGQVSLDSEVGRGTTFTLTIPLAAEKADHGA
jgi:signal transduction histidine kinase